MKIASLLGFALAGCVWASSGVFANTLADGLVAHYPLNEEGERVQDVSGNDRSAFGDYIEVVEGLGGKAFAFDGERSVIMLPEKQEFEVTSDYSVSFWVRLESGSEGIGPIYAQPDFTISNFKGSLRVTFRNPDYPNTGYGDFMGPPINDGEWHHVVFAYSADTLDAVLYLDVEEAVKGIFSHKPAVSTPTTVGAFGRFFFRGELSDLRVYSRFLDSVDVAGLNDAKLNP